MWEECSFTMRVKASDTYSNHWALKDKKKTKMDYTIPLFGVGVGS
jgi:hypothetical protein